MVVLHDGHARPYVAGEWVHLFRILELGETRSARSSFLSELSEGAMPPDERVDGTEYVEILREAIAARNGWKRIFEKCSPVRNTTHDRTDLIYLHGVQYGK